MQLSLEYKKICEAFFKGFYSMTQADKRSLVSLTTLPAFRQPA